MNRLQLSLRSRTAGVDLIASFRSGLSKLSPKRAEPNLSGLPSGIDFLGWNDDDPAVFGDQP
jgi:hypothetical protein